MTVVDALRLYMTYRATSEKAAFDAYDLTREVLQAAYDDGVRLFFGVTVDDIGIVADQQAPAVLARYRELCLLRKLAHQDRLYATIDIGGYPFHCVMTASEKTDGPGTYLLWLEPQGVDDDFKTPMMPTDAEADDDA